MSTNLTDEIRAVEAAAQKKVADATAEAAALVSAARDEMARLVKETRQQQYREYREQLDALEQQASREAAEKVEAGRKAAADFVKRHQDVLAGTSQWVAEEVMSRYGHS